MILFELMVIHVQTPIVFPYVSRGVCFCWFFFLKQLFLSNWTAAEVNQLPRVQKQRNNETFSQACLNRFFFFFFLYFQGNLQQENRPRPERIWEEELRVATVAPLGD